MTGGDGAFERRYYSLYKVRLCLDGIFGRCEARETEWTMEARGRVYNSVSLADSQGGGGFQLHRNIGIACGCLVLLCLCLGVSYAAYANLPAIMRALGQ